MPTWRDNLRRWLSAVVLRPLDTLVEANAQKVAEAAAKGLAPAGMGGGLMGGGGAFGGGGGLFGGGGGSSLFGAAKPPPPPLGSSGLAGLGGATAATPSGPAVTTAQWLAHTHTDPASQALIHQYKKLQRFLTLPNYPPESSKRYVRARLTELAAGHCAAAYKWDGGSPAPMVGLPPMDSEILIHIIVTFFDTILPPPVPAAAAAGTAAGGMGGGLMGGMGAKPMGGGGLFGAPLGGGLGGGTSLFGAPAGGAAAPAAAAASGVFWRTETELVGFSSKHYARYTAESKDKCKSDLVLVQQAGTTAELHTSALGQGLLGMSGLPSIVGGGSNASGGGGLIAGSGGSGGASTPPRYSALCDGAEWVVAQGEHNAWEAVVLLVLQRAKRGGVLEGLDLQSALYTEFERALVAEGAASIPRPDTPLIHHGLLSVLHPWSQRLEELDLDEVTAALAN